jgi:hypothetical protein
MDLVLNKWVKVADPADWSARSYLPAIVVNGYIYIAGGSLSGSTRTSEIWRSTDGVVWDLVNSSPGWAARASHGFIFYNNKFWILGGSPSTGAFYNDVWSSDDGVIWTLVTASAPWGIRHQFGFCVHNNRMYICGGYDGVGTFYSDVYSSTNGLSWTLESSNFGAALRQQVLISFLGDLWIYGGSYGVGSGDNTSDIRRSQNNGTTWSVVGSWGPRKEHRAIINDNNDQLALLGGLHGAGLYNDVWKTTNGINFTEIIQPSVGSPYARAARVAYGIVRIHNNTFIMGGWASSTSYSEVWKESYTVTYDGNGASEGTAPIDSTNYNPEDIVTVQDPGSLSKAPAYTFSSWNTQYDGLGTTYNPGDTFSISVPIVLYAQWLVVPLSGIFYSEAVGSNTYPFDTREKAATNLNNIWSSVPGGELQPGWKVYVFGTINEPHNLLWGYYYCNGAQVIGESPQTTIINLSTNSFDTSSLYNITLIVSEPDAAGSMIVYNPVEILNCKFDGGNISDWALYSNYYSSIKIICNSFENFTGNAIEISGSGPGDIVCIANSFNNVFGVLFDIYDTTLDVFHFFNNAIKSHEPTIITLTSVEKHEFQNSNNVSIQGYSYTIDGFPFSPDPTELTTDPLFIGSPPNSLTIDNSSPCFRTGLTWIDLDTPITDLLGIPFADPPSIGAYEYLLGNVVIYSGNGNTGGIAPIDPNEYVSGDPVTVLGLGSLVKDDYTFTNWNTSADGSGISYDPTDIFLMGSSAVTLYAQWIVSPLDAYFVGTPLSAYINDSIHFTDLSIGNPILWDWDFGDGSEHSTEKNPTHSYTSLGRFTVTLKITRGILEDTEIKEQYITIIEKHSGTGFVREQGPTLIFD